MEIVSRIGRLPGIRRVRELIDAIFAHLIEIQRRHDVLEATQARTEAMNQGRFEEVQHRFEEVQSRFAEIQSRQDALERLVISTQLPPKEAGYDVIVTPNEINEKHGTGFLLKRVFGGCPQMMSVRSADHFQGEHSFGEESFLVSHGWSSRPTWFAHTLQQLRGRVARRVICVPYLLDDLKTAITLKEVYRAPICLWLMDDQSVAIHRIPYELMREFLAKCSLRLTTHSEMREAYERAFGFKFYLFPAVVPENLIVEAIKTPRSDLLAEKRGALFGSIWSRKWADQLMHTVKGSGLQCDWYGNNHPLGFELNDTELIEAGITPKGIVPEEQLPDLLARYPYLIVPTGNLEPDDPGTPTARLSLPGRILFGMATANTPVIVLGHPDTPAARFVQHFKIGLRSDYDPDGFRTAVDSVVDEKTQNQMRSNAVLVAPRLSSKDASDWVFRSLDLGKPCDDRFERLMPATVGDKYFTPAMEGYFSPAIGG